MKYKIILPVMAAAVLLLVAGCATNAHYIETGGRESVVNVGQINIQDYIQASDAAVQDLLASGVLNRVQHPPAVLVMSRIVNNTGQQIDTDLLTQHIRVALLKSGKAVTTTTFGRNAQDQTAKGIQEENEFKNDQQSTRLPDFSLSGRIIQTVANAGRTHQSTYSFQLSLTDTRTGNAVWESDKEITKQGTRSAVGF